MNRKLAWGSAFVATVLVGAFVLTRQRFLLSEDTRPEDRASALTARVIEIESLKKDLEAVAGLSKLGLDAAQTETLLDAAKKTDELKRSFMSERSGDLDQAIDV